MSPMIHLSSNSRGSGSVKEGLALIDGIFIDCWSDPCLNGISGHPFFMAQFLRH